MKTIYQSKTFWLAILQGVVGAMLTFTPDMPPYLGILLILKSVTDVLLRYRTSAPVEF